MGIILPHKKYVSQNGGKSLKGCNSLFWAVQIFEKIVFAFYNHVFIYFDILKTVANWTLKSNVVVFEN